MYYIYILYSESQNRCYVGMTASIEKRLKEHNKNKTKSTKGGAPWILLHSENFSTRIEARQREQWHKSGVGRNWLKQNFNRLRSSTG